MLDTLTLQICKFIHIFIPSKATKHVGRYLTTVADFKNCRKGYQNIGHLSILFFSYEKTENNFMCFRLRFITHTCTHCTLVSVVFCLKMRSTAKLKNICRYISKTWIISVHLSATNGRLIYGCINIYVLDCAYANFAYCIF